MPFYNDVPSQAQWDRDLSGLSWLAATRRIRELIAAYHKILGGGKVSFSNMGELMPLLHSMYRQCQFILKNNAKGASYAKEKLGGSLTTEQVKAVDALHTYLANRLETILECDGGQLDAELTKTFGRQVTEHGQQEDARSLKGDTMQWYRSDTLRQMFKLSFRNGLAYQWDYQGQGKGNLAVYDTRSNRDNVEFGGSLYVLDQRGRIYVSGKEGEKALKHSSFMAGEATQCAGTMRIDRGQIIWVSGRSGHYQPTPAQMVNLLERLRSYQVNLKEMKVYRENFTQTFTGTPFRNFEGCQATALLAQRAWPTGVQPMTMRVG